MDNQPPRTPRPPRKPTPSAGSRAPSAADVRLLLGPNAYVRLTCFGREGAPASTVDLTSVAEALCCLGVRLARSVPEPSTVNGGLEGDLGVGGRAMWVDGGGDISTDEVLRAIAATLEQVSVDELLAVWRGVRRRECEAVLSAIALALVHVGISKRSTDVLLRRPQRRLGGRSIADVYAETPLSTESVNAAFTLLVERVEKKLGLAGVERFANRLLPSLR